MGPFGYVGPVSAPSQGKPAPSTSALKRVTPATVSLALGAPPVDLPGPVVVPEIPLPDGSDSMRIRCRDFAGDSSTAAADAERDDDARDADTSCVRNLDRGRSEHGRERRNVLSLATVDGHRDWRSSSRARWR